MHTPVALIIFNRPHHTARVFAEIAKARPEHLFLIADGPRPDRPEDVQRCAAVRDIVARVDWPCQVERNFAERNLGCGRRPGSGISWVFQQVDEAIILEDDCVPDPTFFQFCEDLLEKYREDKRVMNIGGTNWQWPSPRSHHSYFFSIFNITGWGWATWRRAWQYYDPAVRLWPAFRDTSWLLDLCRTCVWRRCSRTPLSAPMPPRGSWTTGTINGPSPAGHTTGCRSSPRPRWSRTWDLDPRRRIRPGWGTSGLGCRRGPWTFRYAILPRWSRTAPPISTSSSA